MRIRKRPATLSPPHFPAAPCPPPSTPHDLAPACLILQTPSQPFNLDLGACRRVHDGIRKRLRVDHEDLDREKEDDVEGLPSNSYPDQERNHAVSVGAGHIAAESFRPRARTMVAAGRHRPHDEAAPFLSAVVPVPAGLVCLSSAASDDDDDRKPKSCPANNSILQGQAEDASKMLQQGKVQVKSMQGGPVRRSCGAQIACRTVHDPMREEVQEVIIESWRRGRQPASSSQCAPQVGMSTTSGAAPQLRKDQTSISPTCEWDHAMKYMDVEWPYHEDSGQALQRLAGGRIQDLQGLCRPLRESRRMCMKSPSWEQDNDMEMGIHELEGGSEKSDRRNYMGSSTVVNNEEKLKKAGGGDDEGEQQRCGRRSGRGWQCKNMRAVGSQTIYCDHHRLKIFEHHATWNARNKLMKKKKKSSTSMKIGGSKKPHQNMVNINGSASTEVVLNHDMENNMHVGGSNSSECCLPDINIFERVLQASQRVKKRRMRRHPRCTASMAFLPNLVETFVPTSPQAHQAEESGPHQGGPGLNLGGFQNMTSSWGVERPEYNTLMVVDDDNGAAGTMSVTHHDDSDGDNDAAGSRGVTHHDDGDMVAEDEERCRRVDGRGWRCKKMRAKDGRNSMYCEHHRAKLREHHEKRSLIRSRERRRGRRSMCNPSRGGGGGGGGVGNSGGAVGAGAVGSKTSGVHGEGGFHNSGDGGESDEDGDHRDEEGSKGQQPLRCGRMDGRGWQCKRMRAKGSIYCEHHGAKLRENHATWNARKRQLSSESQRGGKEEASLDFHKLRAMATTMKGEATPPRRRCPKMRSLQDIQQAHVTL